MNKTWRYHFCPIEEEKKKAKRKYEIEVRKTIVDTLFEK